VRNAWDGLLDFIIAAWLGLLDLLAPLPETPIDRQFVRTASRCNGCSRGSTSAGADKDSIPVPC
jgi:hypothetical protein